MTLDEERMRASEARRGAAEMRRRQYAAEHPPCVFCGYPESDPRHGEPMTAFGGYAVNHVFHAPIGERDV